MPAVDLTDLKVKNWKPTDKRQEIADAKESGLYLLVQPSGAKSWAVRYRFAGRLAKLTIGPYPRWTLKEARGKAREVQRVRTDPLDPRNPREVQEEARRKAREAASADRDLFRVVVERYLKEYASKRRNYPEKARLLGLREDRVRKGNWHVTKGRAVELWGKKRIQDISRRDIREHLDNLVKGAPIGANRAFSELRKFFNWTVSKDILLVSPMAGMSAPSEERESRNRTLLQRDDVPGSTNDELRWLWMACEAYDRGEPKEGKQGHGKKYRGPFGPFVQLLILTGQRRSEVARMTWAEIDRDKRQWTIPGDRAKNGKPHLVPLSEEALAILDQMPCIEGAAGYVFTTNGETPISGYGRMKHRIDALMAEIAERERGKPVAIADWTLHDLRRTLAVGMQRLGIKLEVTEKVINHTSGRFAGIVGVYQVYDYAEEKRTALEAWGRFVINLVVGGSSGNVVPLRSGV